MIRKKSLSFALILILVISIISVGFASNNTRLQSKYDKDSVTYLSKTEYIDVTVEEDNVIFTIDEDAKGDLVIDFKELLAEAYKKNYVPGDSDTLPKIKIVNNSEYEYSYKENSLIVAPLETDKLLNDGYKPTYGTGFDGQKIPMKFAGVITMNTALQSLFDVTSTAKITALHMNNLYETLADIGYEGGMEGGALSKYFLDFYNKKYDTNANKLEELPSRAIFEMTNGNATTAYSETELLEPLSEYIELTATPTIRDSRTRFVIYAYENELSSFYYNYFYNELLALTFDSTIYNPNKDTTDLYSIGNYLDKSTEAYKLGDGVFKDLLVKKGESTTVGNVVFRINGPKTNNAFQYLNFGWYSSIILEQEIIETTEETTEEKTEETTEEKTEETTEETTTEETTTEETTIEETTIEETTIEETTTEETTTEETTTQEETTTDTVAIETDTIPLDPPTTNETINIDDGDEPLDGPKTGDNSGMVMLIILAATAIGAVVVVKLDYIKKRV